MENIIVNITIILFFITGCLLLLLSFTNNEKFLLPRNKEIIINKKLYIKKTKVLSLFSSICSFFISIGSYLQNNIILNLGIVGSGFVLAYIYIFTFKWTK